MIPLGTTVYFAAQAAVWSRSRNAAPTDCRADWLEEEINGQLLFSSRVFTPSSRSGNALVSCCQSIPQASSLRMCGVRVAWQVGLKLSRCVRPHSLVTLSLEDEDDELFGGGADFTHVLLNWNQAAGGD